MRIRSIGPIVAAVAVAALAWRPASAAAPAVSGQNHVHSILILPTNPNVIYMGTHYHLYESSNGGKTWKVLLSQMAVSLAMNPSHPQTMYAVTLQNGFLTSTDGGKHWSAPHGRPSKASVAGVAYDAAGKTILAYGAGIYRSTDGGKHWTSTMKSQSFTSMSIAPDGTGYAASSNGLFVSHDHGAHWKGVATIGSQPVLQVVSSGRTAYAVGPIALFKTANDGKSWTTLSNAPIGIEFLGVAPSDSDEVFGEITGKGFYVTRDGGSSWRRAGAGIHDSRFTSSVIRIAPSSPKIAYTGAWGLHFYATRDGGRHWVLTASLNK